MKSLAACFHLFVCITLTQADTFTWFVVEGNCYGVSGQTRQFSAASSTKCDTTSVVDSLTVLDAMAVYLDGVLSADTTFWVGAKKISGNYAWLSGGAVAGDLWEDGLTPNSDCVAVSRTTVGGKVVMRLVDRHCGTDLYYICQKTSCPGDAANLTPASPTDSVTTSSQVTSTPPPETVTSEAVTSETVTSETVTSETVSPQAVTSQAVTSQAVTSQAVTSQEVTSQAVTSQTITPQTDSSVETTMVSTRSTPAKMCPCVCTSNTATTSAPETVQEIVEKLQKELTVDKTTLSKTTRKKISVQDERTSAVATGSVGIVFFAAVFAFLVFSDLRNVYVHLRRLGS